MMTILVSAIADFKPSLGGIAELTHELAEYSCRAGASISVVAMEQEGDHVFDNAACYSVVRLGKGRTHKTFEAILDDVQPDVVLVNVLGHSSWLHAFRGARARGIPIVLFTHGHEITVNRRRPDRYLAVSLAVRLSSGLLSPSQFTRRYLIDHYGADPLRCFVVPPGIDPSFADTVERDSSVVDGIPTGGKRIILSLNRLIKRKGVDYAILAVEHLCKRGHDDVLYLVAGGGPESETLRAIVEERRLDDIVHFLQPVSEAQKHYLYSIQDVFLMPNRILPRGDFEGFGITFLEANMYGKPVIGGRCAGAMEAIEEGKTGLLVNPTDPIEIAEALERVLYTEGLAAQLGEQGRERALSLFSYERIATTFMDSLQKTSVNRGQPE